MFIKYRGMDNEKVKLGQREDEVEMVNVWIKRGQRVVTNKLSNFS